MAMIAGTVAVDGDGVATGSGLALELYTALVAEQFAALGDVLSGLPPDRALAFEMSLKRWWALTCRGFATALVAHLQANAVAVIETSDGALQRTPNPNNADTDTQGPAARRELGIE